MRPGFGGTKSLNDLEASIGNSAKDMLDQLVWWGTATKAARNDDAAAAQAAE